MAKSCLQLDLPSRERYGSSVEVEADCYPVISIHLKLASPLFSMHGSSKSLDVSFAFWGEKLDKTTRTLFFRDKILQSVRDVARSAYMQDMPCNEQLCGWREKSKRH
ncbi:hypothetical protein RRG08_009182 [Elysia crispata]|uniref:Uncharacterized protein n=1 Tax=Elysia crispata TaxID=231223 RepID=A0AAE1DJL5_9GAST|nr:hypothetical protein RRG08_009182 [Elysia crispata]